MNRFFSNFLDIFNIKNIYFIRTFGVSTPTIHMILSIITLAFGIKQYIMLRDYFEDVIK